MFLNPFLLCLCPHLTFPLLTSPHILHPLLFFPSFHLCLISPCYLHFLNSSLFYIFLVFFSLSSFLTSTQPVSFFLWSHLFKFTSSSCPNGSFPQLTCSCFSLSSYFPSFFITLSYFALPFVTFQQLFFCFSSVFVPTLFLFNFFLPPLLPCHLCSSSLSCLYLFFPSHSLPFLMLSFFSIPFPTFPFNCHCFYLFF